MVPLVAGLSRVLAEIAKQDAALHGRLTGQTAPRRNGAANPTSSVQTFTDRVRTMLMESIGTTATADAKLDSGALRRRVADELARIIQAEQLPLNDVERHAIVGTVMDDVLGYGPIEPLLRDPEISEIMVNGTEAVYVERNGRIELSDARFRTEGQLNQVINRIVSSVGRRVDESSPMVDARLADGSRVNAIIAPLAVDGPSLTIRKFGQDGITAEELVEMGALTDQSLAFLRGAIQGKLNVVVSGGTGSGKTTFLNVLSSFIPETERIVTIEDAVELRLRQRHVIRLETRPSNIEGRGEVGIRELVRNSLRMRPDRIIVGECRGAEALDMLQAMNTGHDGSLTTLHANTPPDAISRLETMVLLTGFEIPQRAIREQLASAIDVMVQLERLRSGRRVVSSITELHGLVDNELQLNELFALDYNESRTTEKVRLRPTGAPAECLTRLTKRGVTLGHWVLADPIARRPKVRAGHGDHKIGLHTTALDGTDRSGPPLVLQPIDHLPNLRPTPTAGSSTAPDPSEPPSNVEPSQHSGPSDPLSRSRTEEVAKPEPARAEIPVERDDEPLVDDEQPDTDTPPQDETTEPRAIANPSEQVEQVDTSNLARAFDRADLARAFGHISPDDIAHSAEEEEPTEVADRPRPNNPKATAEPDPSDEGDDETDQPSAAPAGWLFGAR